MDTEKFTYKTKSLDELSLALAMGAEVVKVDRDSDERFFTFHLSAPFDMEKTSLQLASKTIKFHICDREVDIYDLLDAVRRSKSIIHQR